MPGSLGRGKLGPDQVLVDHRQFGAEVVIVDDDTGDLPAAEKLACLQAMAAGDHLVAFPNWADPDRLEKPDRSMLSASADKASSCRGAEHQGDAGSARWGLYE